jgi:hypothetical protein
MNRTLLALGMMAFTGAGLAAVAAAGCGSSGNAFGSGGGNDSTSASGNGGQSDSGTGMTTTGQGDGSFGSAVSDASGQGFHSTGATDASGTCGLGSAASSATNESASTLNLFGQIVYYDDGGDLPMGRYEAKYLGGCMKYDWLFNWQVQASWADAGGGGFWFVGDTSTERIVMAPGVTQSYADFDACVGANMTASPEDFDFAGGKLGIWLNDDPYTDNVAGPDGGNPRWQLTLLGACPPDITPQ